MCRYFCSIDLLACVLGENVQQFFFRVASLAFEDSILKDNEFSYSAAQIGNADVLSTTIHLFLHA